MTDTIERLGRAIAEDIEALEDVPGAEVARMYAERYQRILMGMPALSGYCMREMLERTGAL